MQKLTLENTTCNTWFERDRGMVLIENITDLTTVAEFWDDNIYSLVEDGYLDPKNWHLSAINYLNQLWGLK